jgi:hypothetical protein
MEGVTENFGAEIIKLYREFISFLPPTVGEFFNLLVLILLIVLYSIFIWKFYRFISTKNFFGLDLNKYNQSQSPLFTKLLKGGFYFLEYIIILPFLIFFWFSIFTIFLIILTATQEIYQILIISAAVIASIRTVAYYKEDLSREIAKLFPFTLLAIIVLNPNTFSEIQYMERIATHLSQIPNFFSQIGYYLLFIIILEIILRFFDFIFSLFGLEEVEVKENKEKTEEES